MQTKVKIYQHPQTLKYSVSCREFKVSPYPSNRAIVKYAVDNHIVKLTFDIDSAKASRFNRFTKCDWFNDLVKRWAYISKDSTIEFNPIMATIEIDGRYKKLAPWMAAEMLNEGTKTTSRRVERGEGHLAEFKHVYGHLIN